MNNGTFKENKDRKQKIATFCSHFVVLFILIFSPEIVMNISDVQRTDIPTHIYVKIVLFLAVYYINYYVIIDRCFDGRNPKVKFAAYNILLLGVMLAVCYIMWESEPSHRHPAMYHGHAPGMPPLPPPDRHPHLPMEMTDLQQVAHSLNRYIRDAVMMVFVMFLALALKLRSRWSAFVHYKNRLDAMQKEAELGNLKAQLNPHFLFNTLNSIYALIAVNPEKAQWAVHELSGMLRYMLYENPLTVKLKQEVEFVNSYVALMCMRFCENDICVSVNVDESMDDAEIAPLMFVTIIENVFKHGVSQYKDKPAEIFLSADSGIVRCYTSNYCKAGEPKSGTSGIGLKNLRRRLNLIYGKNAELKTGVTGDTFVVELMIDLNNRANNK